MKHLLPVLLGLLALALPSTRASAQLTLVDSVLTVVLLDVPSDRGEVLVALYDEARYWNQPLRAKYVRRQAARAGRMDIEFAHLAPGRYAIAALHDADASGHVTTGLFGIPKEAYGFGNDARGTFGPPAFAESVVAFRGTGRTRIRLK